MPKRFFEYSRTEPARTMLFTIAFLTFVFQAATLLPFITPLAYFWGQAFNVVLVTIPALLACIGAYKNKVKPMARWSFWLFVIWLFTGLSRLAFSPDPTELLWVPMLVVAMCLAVIHIYMKALEKGVVDE